MKVFTVLVNLALASSTVAVAVDFAERACGATGASCTTGSDCCVYCDPSTYTCRDTSTCVASGTVAVLGASQCCSGEADSSTGVCT
ncbi:hypothetical protein VMCG_07164 [Cytospora schulzeri]|uniref:Uncharacterized protein n=1 Tax=Cytospora schulzeri TaxID=448051 RepID=A0A423W4W5_9PEZI|nr:hypothetical protein VMCG_07164 [Valsa malicola]